MASYIIRRWFQKFLVMQTRPETVVKYYLKGFTRDGAPVWVTDPLSARSYSMTTAKKHLKALELADF